MRTHFQHPWRVSPREARAIQDRLRQHVQAKVSPHLCQRLQGHRGHVAGADISYGRFSDVLYAAILVFRYPELTLVETASHRARVTFPYIPGLLSFRELPVLVAAFAKLKTHPDLLLCDGQGLAHPRRFGLASHLGLLLDLPTIGCAKSRLIGTHREPGRRRGSAVPLLDQGEVIGRVLRTRTDVRPLYISIGHKIDLEMAVAVVLHCAPRYRLPEPTRQAHLEVNRIRASLRGK